MEKTMKNYRLAVDENGSPFVLNSKGSIDFGYITEEMNLRSEKGRELKWPSLTKLLEKDGYIIYPEKHRQQRGWRIHRITA